MIDRDAVKRVPSLNESSRVKNVSRDKIPFVSTSEPFGSHLGRFHGNHLPSTLDRRVIWPNKVFRFITAPSGRAIGNGAKRGGGAITFRPLPPLPGRYIPWQRSSGSFQKPGWRSVAEGWRRNGGCMVDVELTFATNVVARWEENGPQSQHELAQEAGLGVLEDLHPPQRVQVHVYRDLRFQFVWNGTSDLIIRGDCFSPALDQRKSGRFDWEGRSGKSGKASGLPMLLGISDSVCDFSFPSFWGITLRLRSPFW